MLTLESLPVELIAEILSDLDLKSLITVSYLSRRLHHVCADAQVNPWRRPILRNLRSGTYEPCLRNLSVRTVPPRNNWIEIMSIAEPHFLLFQATLPNLSDDEWRECFTRRFLPSMQHWRRNTRWKEVFMKILSRLWHRGETLCTTDEAWQKYIVLNRNGSANLLEATARNFSPLAIMHEMKVQSNLANLETRVRVLVELADIRILVLGVLHNPSSPFYVNINAQALLRPPHIAIKDVSGHDIVSGKNSGVRNDWRRRSSPLQANPRLMMHPLPSTSFSNYPYFTPGGEDRRWQGYGNTEDTGKVWIGGLMIVAQVVGPRTKRRYPDGPVSEDLQLVVGPGRAQYASLSWADLDAVAPWMHSLITLRMDGPGLGI